MVSLQYKIVTFSARKRPGSRNREVRSNTLPEPSTGSSHLAALEARHAPHTSCGGRVLDGPASEDEDPYASYPEYSRANSRTRSSHKHLGNPGDLTIPDTLGNPGTLGVGFSQRDRATTVHRPCELRVNITSPHHTRTSTGATCPHNQESNQPSNQATKQRTNERTNHTNNRRTNQPTIQPSNQPTNQPIPHPARAEVYVR